MLDYNDDMVRLFVLSQIPIDLRWVYDAMHMLWQEGKLSFNEYIFMLHDLYYENNKELS